MNKTELTHCSSGYVPQAVFSLSDSQSSPPALEKNQRSILIVQKYEELQFASKKLVLDVIKREARALRFASEKLRDNKKIVLAAVNKNALAIQYRTAKK